MRLLYDLYCTQPSKSAVHGGGVYGQTLFEALMQSDRVGSGDVKVTVLLHPDKEIPKKLDALLTERGVVRVDCRNTGDVVNALSSGGWDRFYSPLPNYLMDGLKKAPETPIFATLHDVRDLDVRYDWFHRNYQPNALKRARLLLLHFFEERRLSGVRKNVGKFLRLMRGRIITDSLHSKYRFLTEFPEAAGNRIVVFYPIEKTPEIVTEGRKSEILGKYSLQKKGFFLMLACNRPGKNALRVIAAVDRWKALDGTDLKILCVGFRRDQVSRIRKLFPAGYEKCEFIPYVTEEELVALYAEAFCFLFPSISEGFGYPPLEAMRQGTPVIAAGVTSIPEVCGDAVLYVNPYSLQEIAYRIREMIEEPDVRAACIAKGEKRIREIDGIHAQEKDRLVEEILRDE